MRILPEGWVDYSRTPSPQSDGLYGAHFWVTPGSLGIFSCQGAWGQRILIMPKLDLVVVRLGRDGAAQGRRRGPVLQRAGGRVPPDGELTAG